MFVAWWESLTGAQQLLACGALPATLILAIQTILLLFGLGGGHAADQGEVSLDGGIETDAPELEMGDDGMDAPPAEFEDAVHFVPSEEGEMMHDGAHHALGVRILTVRGIVAFVAVGGWLGIAMIDLGLGAVLSILIGFLGGTLALFAIAWILKISLSLQENGNISIKNAIAQVGSVYITIPSNRSGTGKVLLTVQERFLEMQAVTDSDQPLKTGMQVQVVGTTGGDTLVVRPLVAEICTDQ